MVCGSLLPGYFDYYGLDDDLEFKVGWYLFEPSDELVKEWLITTDDKTKNTSTQIISTSNMGHFWGVVTG